MNSLTSIRHSAWTTRCRWCRGINIWFVITIHFMNCIQTHTIQLNRKYQSLINVHSCNSSHLPYWLASIHRRRIVEASNRIKLSTSAGTWPRKRYFLLPNHLSHVCCSFGVRKKQRSRVRAHYSNIWRWMHKFYCNSCRGCKMLTGLPSVTLYQWID